MSVTLQSGTTESQQEMVKRRYEYEKAKENIEGRNLFLSCCGGVISGLGGLLSGATALGVAGVLGDKYEYTLIGDILGSGIGKACIGIAATAGVAYLGCRFFSEKSLSIGDKELSKLKQEYADVLTQEEKESNIDINS